MVVYHHRAVFDVLAGVHEVDAEHVEVALFAAEVLIHADADDVAAQGHDGVAQGCAFADVDAVVGHMLGGFGPFLNERGGDVRVLAGGDFHAFGQSCVTVVFHDDVRMSLVGGGDHQMESVEVLPRAVHLDEHGLGDLTGQFQNGCGAAGFPFDCGDAVVGLGHSAGQALTELDLAELHAFGQRRAVNHGDFDLRFAGRLEHGEELVDALDRRVAPFVLLAAGLRVVACVERAHGMVHGGRHSGRNRVRVVGVGDRNLDFLDGCCVVGHRNQPTDPSI